MAVLLNEPQSRARARVPLLAVAKAVVWLSMTLLLWQTSWLSDDAVISLRSALNWAHGYGPNFNIDEAVASYTHPLWFAFITLQGSLTGSWVYGTLYLALAFASAAVMLLVLQARNWWQLSVISMLLLLGNTVLDWLGSGLEGSLAAFLLCAIAYVCLKRPHPAVGVLIALLLLCRLDFALLIAPIGVWLVWNWRTQPRRLLWFLVGALGPLLVWAAWAQHSYASVLPSTFAAKTNSTIPAGELLARGTEFLTASVRYDPSLLAVAALLVITMWAGDASVRVWLTGVPLYVLYITVIGGDYLLGRFMMVPVMAVLLGITSTDLPDRRGGRVLWLVPLAALVLALPATRVLDLDASQPFRTSKTYFQDERPGWSLAGRSLDPLDRIETRETIVRTDLPYLDEVARRWPSGAKYDGTTIVVCNALGAISFQTPLSVHIIDPCGLADPFLASLPFSPNGFWKAGHLERPLPAGYEEAVRTHDPSKVVDPALRERLQQMW